MMRRHAQLLTVVLIISLLIPAVAAGQVRGHLVDADSGEPVAGALVWLNGRTIHMTRSASDGAYEFTDAPPGSYCIRVDSPGYSGTGACISVSAGARMIVDMPLTVRPLVMAPLLVAGRRGMVPGRSRNEELAAGPPVASTDVQMLRAYSSALAGAQLGDLTHTSMDVPGGGRPHTLYVWGSSAERGRVLLDGATLNAPLHLGALLPPLDPDVIAVADVRSGGISPRYDGGTSYIMDFTTRPAADEMSIRGEVDLLAARVGAESPIGGRGSVVMSARRVNDEVIDGLVSSRFGYGYSDALVRADLDIDDDNGVHVTLLTTREAVTIPRDLAEDRASWNNHVATLVWERAAPGSGASATLSMSRGVADLPLLSAVGGHLEASLDRFSGTTRKRGTVGAIAWSGGAEIEHLVFRRRARASADPATGQTGRLECTVSLPCSHANATFASTFAELSLSPAARVQASVGARAMYDISAGRVHVLPRATVTLLPTQRYSITLAAGRFSQAHVREASLTSDAPRVDLPIGVHVAHATHVELAVARSSARFTLRAGAYVRRHARVEPTMRPRTVPGADVSLEYSAPAASLAIAYSISRGHAAVHQNGAGAAAAQQLVTAGVGARQGRFTLDVNAAYGTGLPLTSIVLEQPIDAEMILQPAIGSRDGADQEARRRSYLRLDASLSAEWRTGRNDRIRLMPYIRIINALGQRESLFYFQDEDLSQPPRGLARLPAVPMIGLRWQF